MIKPVQFCNCKLEHFKQPKTNSNKNIDTTMEASEEELANLDND